MKIVIAGLSRSGTSALFFKIKNSIPSRAKCLFEPTKYVYSADDDTQIILSKILLNDARLENDYESFNCFDKKILVVRDPRDRLISMLLYQVCPSFYRDKKRILKLVNLLKRKESRPRLVSVLDILGLIKRFGWYDFWKKAWTSPKPAKLQRALKNIEFWMDYIYGKYFNSSIDFHNQHKDYFAIKYEDFIAGKIKDLENYLGFKLPGEATVDNTLRTVMRAGKSGNWKNWFLRKDIKFFKPFFTPFMEKYNYPDDWVISANPKIYPQYCSQYVMEVVKEQKLGGKNPQTKVFQSHNA